MKIILEKIANFLNISTEESNKDTIIYIKHGYGFITLAIVLFFLCFIIAILELVVIGLLILIF